MNYLRIGRKNLRKTKRCLQKKNVIAYPRGSVLADRVLRFL